jgi:hypothetical protein
MANYTAGDVVQVSVLFTNNNVATDPTTVTLYVKNTTAGLTQYIYGSSAIVKNGTGSYSYNLTTTASGQWWYRWTGAGALTAAAEGSFTAGPSAFV